MKINRIKNIILINLIFVSAMISGCGDAPQSEVSVLENDSSALQSDGNISGSERYSVFCDELELPEIPSITEEWLDREKKSYYTHVAGNVTETEGGCVARMDAGVYGDTLYVIDELCSKALMGNNNPDYPYFYDLYGICLRTVNQSGENNAYLINYNDVFDDRLVEITELIGVLEDTVFSG